MGNFFLGDVVYVEFFCVFFLGDVVDYDFVRFEGSCYGEDV